LFSVRDLMLKYLSERGEIDFNVIFDQEIGEFADFIGVRVLLY